MKEGGEDVNEKKIVETLEKQLQLLSERSEKAETAELSHLTDSMTRVVTVLLALRNNQTSL